MSGWRLCRSLEKNVSLPILKRLWYGSTATTLSDSLWLWYLTIKGYSPFTNLYTFEIPNKEVYMGLMKGLLR